MPEPTKPSYGELVEALALAERASRSGTMRMPYQSANARVGEPASTVEDDLTALVARLNEATAESEPFATPTSAYVASQCAELCVSIRDERKLTGREGMVAELMAARIRTFARALLDEETTAPRLKIWGWAYVARPAQPDVQAHIQVRRATTGEFAKRELFREYALTPIDPSLVAT